MTQPICWADVDLSSSAAREWKLVCVSGREASSKTIASAAPAAISAAAIAAVAQGYFDAQDISPQRG